MKLVKKFWIILFLIILECFICIHTKINTKKLHFSKLETKKRKSKKIKSKRSKEGDYNSAQPYTSSPTQAQYGYSLAGAQQTPPANRKFNGSLFLKDGQNYDDVFGKSQQGNFGSQNSPQYQVPTYNNGSVTQGYQAPPANRKFNGSLFLKDDQNYDDV